MDCPFVTEGDSDDDAMAKLLEHAEADHADMMSNMGDEEKDAMMTKAREMLEMQG